MDGLGDILARKRIQDIIPPPRDDRRTERGEWLKMFCDRLNADRIKNNFSKISIGRMGRILQGIPTGDMYAFYRACDKAKNFSKYFWWALNPQKHQ